MEFFVSTSVGTISRPPYRTAGQPARTDVPEAPRGQRQLFVGTPCSDSVMYVLLRVIKSEFDGIDSWGRSAVISAMFSLTGDINDVERRE